MVPSPRLQHRCDRGRPAAPKNVCPSTGLVEPSHSLSRTSSTWAAAPEAHSTAPGPELHGSRIFCTNGILDMCQTLVLLSMQRVPGTLWGGQLLIHWIVSITLAGLKA
ncbi:hypothetical protein NDU88_003780 [Pleurodeles waltl]|uniref:Uncharacterized protein n=1 Tax=Pleurodeles waltl TaxID=8319 RepID=A0AAV7T7L5_PLEWA|nr:hypothetical protein NDU88_003780 [Pleurodeles waltl]